MNMIEVNPNAIVLSDGIDSIDDILADVRSHNEALSVQITDGSLFINQFRTGPIIIEQKEAQQIFEWLQKKGIVKGEITDGK